MLRTSRPGRSTASSRSRRLGWSRNGGTYPGAADDPLGRAVRRKNGRRYGWYGTCSLQGKAAAEAEAEAELATAAAAAATCVLDWVYSRLVGKAASHRTRALLVLGRSGPSLVSEMGRTIASKISSARARRVHVKRGRGERCRVPFFQNPRTAQPRDEVDSAVLELDSSPSISIRPCSSRKLRHPS